MAAIGGAAIILGVVAGTRGNVPALIVVVACVVGVAVLSGGALRVMMLLAAAGFTIGAITGVVDSGADDVDINPVPDIIDARIVSDPRLTPGGQFVDIAWTGPSGVSETAPLIMPATISAGRDDRIILRRVDVDEVEGLIIAERVEVIPGAGRVERLRRRIRSSATERILAVVPGSNGSLALGLLIGDDSGLTTAERRDMRASGLSHITAVSGSNVSMVIVLAAFVIFWLTRRSWIWIVPQLLAIGGYVWVVGGEPPIVRAAIMGSLALIAVGLGRPAHLFTLLFLAGALMALHDPGVLSTLSFQLSFVSMIALGIVGTRIQRIEGRGRQLAAIMASPAAAALATAPLIALRFGTFSLGTVPANAAVAPVIAPATGLAAVAAVAGDIPLVGQVIGVMLWLCTGYVLEIARFVGRFPGAYWTFAPPTAGVVVLVYLMLVAMTIPVLPEGRLALYRLRRWVASEPATAFSSATAGLALLWALASLSN